MLRALVAGCFSFENGHATAGDLLACELACDWLKEAGMPFDVARVAGLGTGGIDWKHADPAAYSHVVYVCGPFERGGELETRLLQRFGDSRLVGVDLSMLTPLADWNPFDLLLERDSTRAANPDITFASTRPRAPVVGVCLVEDYPGAEVGEANAAIERLMAASPVARVDIDTRLDENRTGLRTAAEVEAVLARMDTVVTTRLHGMVLSLKNGVPVVAIDPERGGAKVQRQAAVLAWPAAMPVDAATEPALRAALDWCLSEAGRARARECAQQAIGRVDELRRRFIAAFRDGSIPDSAQAARAAATVSVVIRDLGHETWLADAIRSVQSQSHAATEIVVVHRDGSAVPGDPGAAPALKFVSAPFDAAEARNAGAAASRGEYLVFMDSDERLLPNALRDGLNSFRLFPESALAIGVCRQVGADGRARSRPMRPAPGDTFAAALEDNPFDGPAILYRRDAFDAAGGFDGASSASGHQALGLRIAAARPIRTYDEEVAERVVRDGSPCLQAGPMLAASVAALAAQWPSVRDDPRRARAVRAGIRQARIAARTPLVHHLRASLATGRPGSIARSLGRLLAYVPAWLRSFAVQLRA